MNRIFRFRLRTCCDYEGWRENLERVIKNSNGAQRNIEFSDCMKQVESGYKFWKFVRISEESFLEQAETGDIILCSNKKAFKDLHVDRVYILIRLISGLHVLRPAENFENGVLIETWEKFQRYKYKRFTDILHRHLYCDRSTNSKFIKEVQRFLSKIQKEPHIRNSKGDYRIFKSSELAANFFLELGFLPECKEITSYTPKDFS